MTKETNQATDVIALAPVYQDGAIVRGKIPAPIVRALKAKGGDVLAFERQANGTIILRKSTSAERQKPVSKK